MWTSPLLAYSVTARDMGGSLHRARARRVDQDVFALAADAVGADARESVAQHAGEGAGVAAAMAVDDERAVALHERNDGLHHRTRAVYVGVGGVLHDEVEAAT